MMKVTWTSEPFLRKTPIPLKIKEEDDDDDDLELNIIFDY